MPFDFCHFGLEYLQNYNIEISFDHRLPDRIFRNTGSRTNGAMIAWLITFFIVMVGVRYASNIISALLMKLYERK
jgi:hypothetical protein